VFYDDNYNITDVTMNEHLLQATEAVSIFITKISIFKKKIIRQTHHFYCNQSYFDKILSFTII